MKNGDDQRLKPEELRNFSEALLLIHSPRDLEAIPRAAFAALKRIIPGDLVAYNEFHAHGTIAIGDPETPDPRYIEVFEAFMHEHPSLSHILKTGSEKAARISDFSSNARWHSTNLYNQFFRAFALNYQVGCVFEVASSARIGFSINRTGRDFTDGERHLMSLLAPHFAQAWDRASTMTLQKRALSSIAVMEVDGCGKIEFATERATLLMNTCFPLTPLSSTCLPAPLRRWFLQTVENTATNLAPFVPSVTEHGHRRLTVRIAAVPGENLYQLLFDEDELMTPEILGKAFGLTPRESEVLFWINEGKTNGEIAVIVGAKIKTIQKHVERILQKLGVENRASASRVCRDRAFGVSGGNAAR
jgi:DNA-binding CsgD family transcriptional regulator